MRAHGELKKSKTHNCYISDHTYMGRDFDQVIEVLANKAACTDDGMSISPLRNLDRRGGARTMLRQQLRRALRVVLFVGMQS